MDDNLESLPDLLIGLSVQGVTPAEANAGIEELREAILAAVPPSEAPSQSPSLKVQRVKDDKRTQDLGAILEVVLNASAVVVLATGVRAWLRQRVRSKVVIRCGDTSIEADHLSDRSARELAERIGQRCLNRHLP